MSATLFYDTNEIVSTYHSNEPVEPRTLDNDYSAPGDQTGDYRSDNASGVSMRVVSILS